MMSSDDEFKILKQIIESSSGELSLIPVSNNDNIKKFKEARKSYFLNDLNGLKESLSYFSQNKTWKYASICKAILEIRILIREANFKNWSPEKLHSSDNFLIHVNDSLFCLFLVELIAVEAIFSDLVGNHELCYQKNLRAAELAEELGLLKKASTLNYNAIVALNHKSPQLKISYLVEAVQRAETALDYNTQIAALTSLSEEYEKLECFNLAYEEGSKAVELAKKHCFGSFNYCYVLMTCARLAIYSGRLDIAKEQIKLVEVFGFKEFKVKIEEAKNLLNSNHSYQSLSGDEQRLIYLLTTGPKDKYFLIDNIYGAGDSESLDNRLKQLFLRLRKKHKGLIAFNKKDSVYELKN